MSAGIKNRKGTYIGTNPLRSFQRLTLAPEFVLGPTVWSDERIKRISSKVRTGARTFDPGTRMLRL